MSPRSMAKNNIALSEKYAVRQSNAEEASGAGSAFESRKHLHQR